MSRTIDWLNDLADGLGYGTVMALVAFALLMPGDALRAVEALTMLVMP